MRISDWSKAVMHSTEEIKGQRHLYGSLSLTKGADKLSGRGAYIKQVFANLASTAQLEIFRLFHAFVTGKWVNNASAYKDLNARVDELREIVYAGVLTTDERIQVQMGINKMLGVCEVLK